LERPKGEAKKFPMALQKDNLRNFYKSLKKQSLKTSLNLQKGSLKLLETYERVMFVPPPPFLKTNSMKSTYKP